MPFSTIPAPTDPKQPLPDPPTSGNWLRLPDGGLQPADEATARGAGLFIDEPPAEPAQPEA